MTAEPVRNARVTLLATLLALALPACEKPTTPDHTEPAVAPAASVAEVEAEESEAGTRVPFDIARVFFEFNTTDHDLGLQVFLDAEDWKRVKVLDPAREEIVVIEAESKLKRLGITELRFESAEPSPEEVLARFPPGPYRFRGRTVDNALLVGTATLSHEFLPAPTFSPSGGEIVDPRRTVVRWHAPDARRVEVILENDDLGHVLDVTLSGSTTRLRIPPQFLTPETEYKIEILAIAENGNRTIAESTFRTGS